jgi:ABC-2 type transport system ATP-binding protein
MSIIEVENLTKTFKNFVAVDHINFAVEKGEIFGFLGPNGAGKSTAVSMLCTLLRPTEGTARVAGFDIVKEPSRVREHIGVVTGKVILYNKLTAAENLRLFGRLNHMPKEAIEEQVNRLLKLFQMERWRDHQVGSFSMGMRQRINIARALMHQPECLFLDEPTVGLDPQTTRSIHDLIQQLSQEGMTIALITHLMWEVELLCPRIGIIDHGKLIALDTMHNLKRLVGDGDVVILDLDVSNLSEGLLAQVQSLDCVTSLVRQDDSRLRIHARGKDALDMILDTLRQGGGQIRLLNTVEPTLVPPEKCKLSV